MLQLHSFCFNPFSENTYVLSNEEKKCWIIDPGMYDEQERETFIRYLDGRKLQPQGIINTHAHIDHIFGVQWLMDQYQIPFALHPLEGPVLAGARSSALMFGLSFQATPQPSQVLKEGQELLLGEDLLQVRLAPGHSPGSVVFYNEQAGWLIGGDVLFAGSIGRTDLPGGNHEQLLQSIRSQLFSLPPETVVYPGHGAETSIAEEMQYNPFLRP
ncbi:MAG: MBL fold metallo-hydrolase [Bacteroidetes bacterium]|nr:MBL fold metallo-hydrolase [Bacteroidota bacterium]MBS1629687.1 MBL fold metallo-hydrolase [Bacteroidota bacterium]